MAKVIREAIQVYLSPAEREEVERASRELGVSRSEVLRRGIHAVGGSGHLGDLRDLVADGYVTAPMRGPGEPPSAAPIMTLEAMLGDLEEDRRDR